MQQVLNLNFAFGPEKFRSFLETGRRPVDVDETSDQYIELALVGLVSPACITGARKGGRKGRKA